MSADEANQGEIEINYTVTAEVNFNKSDQIWYRDSQLFESYQGTVNFSNWWEFVWIRVVGKYKKLETLKFESSKWNWIEWRLKVRTEVRKLAIT